MPRILASRCARARVGRISPRQSARRERIVSGDDVRDTARPVRICLGGARRELQSPVPGELNLCSGSSVNIGQFGSPRYSAWYSVGLLARNGKGDVEAASSMLKDVYVLNRLVQPCSNCSFTVSRTKYELRSRVISPLTRSQFTDPTKNWFGTYKGEDLMSRTLFPPPTIAVRHSNRARPRRSLPSHGMSL